MKRWWRREVLKFVDAWACRAGTPEDDEDAREEKREMVDAMRGEEDGEEWMGRASHDEEVIEGCRGRGSTDSEESAWDVVDVVSDGNGYGHGDDDSNGHGRHEAIELQPAR